MKGFLFRLSNVLLGALVVLAMLPVLNARAQGAAPLAGPTVGRTPETVQAADKQGKEDREVLAALEAQRREMNQELRQIKRELARLRASRDRVSLHDVVSGVGYIVGLFGVAAFVASRKNASKSPGGTADDAP
ncbi:hypothetical protein SAMN02746041_01851 [Desulfacinum hydrothermale DSM 13146]|uniref:Uncharacterized protein n=1 Tax=Desulfacinum hydrothermale DSM 13146 TaxID=1121390 RepID=A0A1W1XJG6_9BACT|nr:hypothetical protein [Desulfacinum hydrothermale]SMC23904.1 hypothetical protein SAMN02746041_01851 [Desulfacinum hydrothermale DSM 13146]